MKRTSEYVSLGHPDKTTDYISEALLDAYIEQDPYTRFAVEVQAKDNFISLAGEVTSKARLSKEDRASIVKQAVEDIGYTHEYAQMWGEGNCIDASCLEVVEHISEQSKDISQGVDNDGWGDQGIFWGMATPDQATDYLPLDIWAAKRICNEIYSSRVAGLDIKTQVTVDNSKATDVIVAVPCLPSNANAAYSAALKAIHNAVGNCSSITINGTGTYVKHSTFGDCGTTGRKLAVDFYGGNCPIGGGSPWTKDGTKADLSLNMLARKFAKENAIKTGQTTYCSLACCIGKPTVVVVLLDKDMRQTSTKTIDIKPEEVIEQLNLRTPTFKRLCKEGLI